MIVSVTEEHIRRGVRDSKTSCPIALAAKDKEVIDPRITISHLWTCGDFYPLSIRARKFIKRFDSGKPVKPIKIRIGIR